MYVSEAMARLGGTMYTPGLRCGGMYYDFTIFGNNFGDHAPEGMERLGTFHAEYEVIGGVHTHYMVPKRQVAMTCVRLGFMTQAEIDQPQVFPAD